MTSMPKHRILIVEDDVDIRQALVSFLSEEGYGVREACNGHQGLLSLESESRQPPALILLDLFMPVMDGEEFLHRLQGHADPELARIPVVAVSAAPPDGEMARLVRARAREFLRKPVNLGTLIECIERHCA